MVGIHLLCFLLWSPLFSQIPAVREFVLNHLILDVSGSMFQEPWRLLTYCFIPAWDGLLGISQPLLLLVWIGFSGWEVQQREGTEAFLTIYFLSVVLAGVFSLMTYSVSGAEDLQLWGSTGGLIGLVAAQLARQPKKMFPMIFIGSLPLYIVFVGVLLLDILGLFSVSHPLLLFLPFWGSIRWIFYL